jgi:hypothetical protein
LKPHVSLPHVTLIAVASVNIDETHAALLHCVDQIEFGAAKFLCSQKPSRPDRRVEYFLIPPLDYAGYSRFMIQSLAAYVHTGHCLVIQADGFVLDPQRWRNEFLQYDYIGAPWPDTIYVCSSPLHLKNTVGNGGFSLRSKRLLELMSAVPFDQLPVVEDVLICHFLFDALVAQGIKFAPPRLAARFSIETKLPKFGQSLDNVFGFHGKDWIPEVSKRLAGVDGSGNRSPTREQPR